MELHELLKLCDIADEELERGNGKGRVSLDSDTLRHILIQIESQNEFMRDELKKLNERICEGSKVFTAVWNKYISGEQPTTEELRAALESYKWAIYGTAIGAQIILAGVELDRKENQEKSNGS